MDFWAAKDIPVCLKGVGEAVIWEEVWVTLSENFVVVRQRNKDALIIKKKAQLTRCSLCFFAGPPE